MNHMQNGNKFDRWLDKHIGKIFLIGLLSMPLSTVIRIAFNI